MTAKPTDDGPEPDGYCKPTACVPAAAHVANMNRQCQWVLDNVKPHDTVPYHDTVRYDKDGYFVPPPADVRLSDRLVFLIIANNLYPGKQRNARWPSDFNTDGDVFPDRWPTGGGVVMWMHGLPFVPIFSGYYVLVGAKFRHYLWIADKKQRNRDMSPDMKGLRFGQIVLPPDCVGDDTLQMEYDEKDWQRFPATLSVRCSSTDNVLLYHKDVIHLTPLPHIIGFHPHSGHKAAYIMDQPVDVADTLWRQMLDTPYSHAKKTARRPLAPGCDASVSLLRCPPSDAYANQDDGTRQKRLSPSNDSNARAKRRRHDEDPADTILQSPPLPTGDIRRLMGDFDDVIPARCDKVDELAKRLQCIKQAKKFLDSPVARKVLEIFSSLVSQRKEYTTAVQDVEKSLDTIDGIAAFALRKVIAEIQKEADGVLGGEQERPITVTDDDPEVGGAENTVPPDNTPADMASRSNADIH